MIISLRLFPITSLFLSMCFSSIQAESGLQFSAVGDLVGEKQWGDQAQSKSWIEPRGIEFMLYGPVDEGFDAQLSVAAHNYRGDYFVELHEAYIESSRLVDSWSFKAGQYFIRQGRLNPLHRHDWNFVSSPISQEYFWDNEGIIDSGIEVRYLLPTAFYLEWTGGLGTGWTFGHRHADPGKSPKRPNIYTKLEHFFLLADDLPIKQAVNFFSRKDSDSIETHLFGYDFIVKKKASRYRNHLIESEIWTRYQKSPMDEAVWESAAYLYAQWAISRRLSAGTRIDARLNWKQGTQNEKYSNWLNLTYRHSEFSLFRLEVGREYLKEDSQESSTRWSLLGQIVFFLGAHPAHEF